MTRLPNLQREHPRQSPPTTHTAGKAWGGTTIAEERFHPHLLDGKQPLRGRHHRDQYHQGGATEVSGAGYSSCIAFISFSSSALFFCKNVTLSG